MTKKQRCQVIILNVVILILISFFAIHSAIEVINNFEAHRPFGVIIYLILFSLSLIGVFAFVLHIIPLAFFEREYSLFGEVVDEGTVVINRRTKQIERIIEAEEFHWHWKNPYWGYDLIKLWNRSFNVSSPYILSGDKIRRLDCDINIKSPKSITDLQKLYKTVGFDILGHWNCGSKNKIFSLILNFCEDRSGLLANLYDPYCEEQQRMFDTLAKEWLDPKLDEWGLKVEQASFTIKK